MGDEAIEKLCGIFDVMRNIDEIRQPYKATDESDDDPFAQWDATYGSYTTASDARSKSLESLTSIASTILTDQNKVIIDTNIELKDIKGDTNIELKDIKGADKYLERMKRAREGRKVEKRRRLT